jgi:hypothetical protein
MRILSEKEILGAVIDNESYCMNCAEVRLPESWEIWLGGANYHELVTTDTISYFMSNAHDPLIHFCYCSGCGDPFSLQ